MDPAALQFTSLSRNELRGPESVVRLLDDVGYHSAPLLIGIGPESAREIVAILGKCAAAGADRYDCNSSQLICLCHEQGRTLWPSRLFLRSLWQIASPHHDLKLNRCHRRRRPWLRHHHRPSNHPNYFGAKLTSTGIDKGLLTTSWEHKAGSCSSFFPGSVTFSLSWPLITQTCCRFF